MDTQMRRLERAAAAGDHEAAARLVLAQMRLGRRFNNEPQIARIFGQQRHANAVAILRELSEYFADHECAYCTASNYGVVPYYSLHSNLFYCGRDCYHAAEVY